ncbi:hypothetical protein J3E64_001881 [Sphingobium sp. OAS761]|uniref:hypothetical protein n=1 Tax=Sphingobium sp. OAS761 TaxID=2817901 RepID=UPI00209F4231|nr:hypothetical protein [Sphingobium sp. OAS761]MCP1470193.1 hypothetical protein [Sphingobium sp. OAS761]
MISIAFRSVQLLFDIEMDEFIGADADERGIIDDRIAPGVVRVRCCEQALSPPPPRSRETGQFQNSNDIAKNLGRQ